MSSEGISAQRNHDSIDEEIKGELENITDSKANSREPISCCTEGKKPDRRTYTSPRTIPHKTIKETFSHVSVKKSLAAQSKLINTAIAVIITVKRVP